MASELYLLAVDDVELADLDMSPAMLTDASDRYNWSTRREQGTESSAFFGAQHEDAVYSVLFQCPNEAAHDAIFGTLVSAMGSERRLLAYRNDADQTRITTHAVVTNIDERNAFDFTVDFEAATALWIDESSTLSSKTLTSARDTAMRVTVPGNSRVSPSLRLSPLLARSAPSAFAGWSKRRRYALTNNADEPLYRYPWRISLGSTTALVSGGTALSSGNDVIVVLDGVQQPRTLVTWNTGASYVWVIIPALLPGDTITFEVWYGNSAAATPTDPSVAGFAAVQAGDVDECILGVPDRRRDRQLRTGVVVAFQGHRGGHRGLRGARRMAAAGDAGEPRHDGYDGAVAG
jgi:hypothetical protein